MEPITALDGIQSATVIFRSLIAGRLTEKYKAVEFLNDPKCSIDLAMLRTLLLKAINTDFSVGKEDEQDDPSIARTRSWLLGTLARISAGDDQTTQLVIKHVDKNFEPYDWARYWALEGLISGKNAEAKAVAKTVAHDNDDPMVSMLATAFLASLNDQEAKQKIKKCLNEASTQWFVLRALRIVPLQATVSAICKIVEEAAYTDETYDAIMALGRIPGEWSNSTTAARALSASIVKMRGSLWKDGMRTGAITGLGNLKAESSGSLIIEELADDNPAIVREAARAIEKILGLNVTVIRIVEAASKSSAAGIDAYARALRWLNREAVAEELETLMITGSARQQDVARTLLSEIGGAVAFEKLRARSDAMKQHLEVLESTEGKIRELFDSSLLEARSGYRLATTMDTVVFALGVGLIILSGILIASGRESITALVAGGSGALAVLYNLFLANPRERVQAAVEHLMRLKVVFLGYLRQLHQADQAFVRRFLDDEPLSPAMVSEYSQLVRSTMESAVSQIGSATTPKSKRRAGSEARSSRIAEVE